MLLLVSVAIVSCKDKSDENIIEPISYKVTVNYGEKFKRKLSENVSVTLISTTSGKNRIQKTNSKGVANFKLVPGVYNIKTTIVLTNEKFKSLFGYDAKQEKISFSAEENNVTIDDTSKTNKIINMLTSRTGNLLFKQIYYTGSRLGSVFRSVFCQDAFFEIYNNSSETIYADGLYFAQLFNNQLKDVKSYTLSDARFDWTQSVGQTKGDKSNTYYCYADNIYQIPGSGKEYPIEPGKSIVIAATAINHKLNGEKTHYYKEDPTSVDLSRADFEVNLTNYFKSRLIPNTFGDFDNPSVTNLNIVYTLDNKELMLDAVGRDSFIIFRTNDYNSYAKVPKPSVKKVTAKTKRYVQIPNDVIIDGVETNNANKTRLFPRRLSTSIDGGYVAIDLSLREKSVMRKVDKIVDGRKILQDTNNSTNDFEIVKVNLKGWAK